jgi:hypothetical protein
MGHEQSNWNGLVSVKLSAHQGVAVGTRVASRPPHGSVRAPLCIRLLPWVFDGESLVWPRVEDSRLWEPVVRQLLHPSPGDVTFLAAATKCAPPAVDDSESECAQCSPVCWYCMVPEVARNDLFQPFPLLGDWLVHSPPQFPSNLAEFRLHAIATGSPFRRNFPRSDLPQMKVNPKKCWIQHFLGYVSFALMLCRALTASKGLLCTQSQQHISLPSS